MVNASLALAFAQLGNLSAAKHYVSLYRKQASEYLLADESLAECEHHVKMADDYILSRALKDIVLSENKEDFGNRYPFIDNERDLLPASDDEVELPVVGPRSILLEEARKAMDNFDFERATAISLELLSRDYDD